jgi:hypothetical protein
MSEFFSHTAKVTNPWFYTNFLPLHAFRPIVPNCENGRMASVENAGKFLLTPFVTQ